MDIILVVLIVAAVIFGIAAWMSKSLTNLGLTVLTLAFILERLS